MDIYKSETYKGYTINICYDNDSCMNPREDWDNLGVIYSNHRYYNPDNHKINELLNDSGNLDYSSLNKDYIWLPVSCYEHSGITFWCGSPADHYDSRWDCSVFGIIAVKKSKVLKEYNWKIITSKRRGRIEDILKGEVKTLAEWCVGEVYGYSIEDKDGYVIDSCTGFIGHDEISFMISECKSIIDSEIERREAEDERVCRMERLVDLCWID